jgi:hypothetical protein
LNRFLRYLCIGDILSLYLNMFLTTFQEALGSPTRVLSGLLEVNVFQTSFGVSLEVEGCLACATF